MCTIIRAAPVMAILALVSTAHADGGQIVVRMPTTMRASSAVAESRELKLESKGVLRNGDLTFTDVLRNTPYDIAITCSDGTILQGIDLGWLNEEPVNPEAGPLTDADREECHTLMTGVKSFYNHQDILLMQGDHDRATALVRLMRDSDFYNNKGGEIVWRIEIYYFRFQYGGWEKVTQANKVLRRERFSSREDMKKATDKIRWISELGGVRVPKDQSSVTIDLNAKPKAATKPSKSDDDDEGEH